MPSVPDSWVADDLGRISSLVDQMSEILDRHNLGSARLRVGHRDRIITVRHRTRLLGSSRDLFVLLQSNKFAVRMQLFDLVCQYRNLTDDVALEDKQIPLCSLQSAGQLITVGEDDDVRRWIRPSALSPRCRLWEQHT